MRLLIAINIDNLDITFSLLHLNQISELNQINNILYY